MKKMIKVAFVAAIAMVAGYNMYQSQSVMNGMSEFALANVEALADCEITKGGSTKLTCEGEGTCSKSYLGYVLTCDGTELK